MCKKRRHNQDQAQQKNKEDTKNLIRNYGLAQNRFVLQNQ